MESMVLLVAGLVAGAALGAIAMWLLNRRKEAGGSVARLKAENDRFKEEVTEHFVETARLINQLTDSYKAVFDHLSGGAEKLVDQEKLSERLPSVEGGEVRLYRIGASESADGKSKTSREAGAPSQPKTASAPRPEERESESKPTPASATGSASAAATASASGGSTVGSGVNAEASKSDTSKSDTAKPDPAAPKSASGTASTSAKADATESSGSSDGKSDKSAKAESRASDNSKSDDLKSGAEASDNTATSKPSERKDPLKKS